MSLYEEINTEPVVCKFVKLVARNPMMDFSSPEMIEMPVKQSLKYESDVTFICSDGKEVKAQRLPLALASAFFVELFKEETSHEPSIVSVPDVYANDMLKVIELCYNRKKDGMVTFDSQSELVEFSKILPMFGLSLANFQGVEGSDSKETETTAEDKEISLEIFEDENELGSDDELLLQGEFLVLDDNKPVFKSKIRRAPRLVTEPTRRSTLLGRNDFRRNGKLPLDDFKAPSTSSSTFKTRSTRSSEAVPLISPKDQISSSPHFSSLSLINIKKEKVESSTQNHSAHTKPFGSTTAVNSLQQGRPPFEKDQIIYDDHDMDIKPFIKNGIWTDVGQRDASPLRVTPSIIRKRKPSQVKKEPNIKKVKLQCSQCPSTFTTGQALVDHTLDHDTIPCNGGESERKIKVVSNKLVKSCAQKRVVKSKSKKQVSHHLVGGDPIDRMVHDVMNFDVNSTKTCHVCKIEYTATSDASHCLSKHGVHRCSLCFNSYTSKDDLAVHQQVVHSYGIDRTPNGKRKAIFEVVCPICNTLKGNKGSAFSHMMSSHWKIPKVARQ